MLRDDPDGAFGARARWELEAIARRAVASRSLEAVAEALSRVAGTPYAADLERIKEYGKRHGAFPVIVEGEVE